MFGKRIIVVLGKVVPGVGWVDRLGYPVLLAKIETK